VPTPKKNWTESEKNESLAKTIQTFRKKLREGVLDEKEIEINILSTRERNRNKHIINYYGC